jgi:hypothetical protein
MSSKGKCFTNRGKSYRSRQQYSRSLYKPHLGRHEDNDLDLLVSTPQLQNEGFQLLKSERRDREEIGGCVKRKFSKQVMEVLVSEWMFQ